LWGAAVFVSLTLTLSLLVLALTPLGLMSAPGTGKVARFWARAILWSIGVKVAVEGLQNLPSQDGFILLSNHQAVFDILAIMGGLPLDIRWLAKVSLFKIPLMGRAMKRCGYIPVDRADSSKALGLLKGAARQVKAGAKVVVFPEGTRNRRPAQGLLPFKKGGFVLACLAGRPIVPMGLIGTDQVMTKDGFRIFPGRQVRIKIGPPLDPARFSRQEVDDFIQTARQSLEVLTGRAGGKP